MTGNLLMKAKAYSVPSSLMKIFFLDMIQVP